MHLPLGFRKDGLGDIDVIAHDDILHAFALCIPNHDRVGHLVSRDGLTWEEQPPAIYTGNPGEFDDDEIWTMGVFQHGGRFFMLYTGLCTREQGKVQRVGLAESDDLYTWTKSGRNPVICADPRWYEAKLDDTHRVDWRDPWVFAEDGRLHGVISARSNTGLSNRRGCAGYFTSTDALNWDVKPPLCVPGVCYDFETPAIAKLRGRYYLTGICGKNTGATAPSVVRVADRIDGPYRRIGHDELLPGDNQVFKPCTWRGRTFYFHNLRGTADWQGGGGNAVTSLAPPKEADADADGALVLRPFRNWEPVALGPAEALTGRALIAAGTPLTGAWEFGDGARRRAPGSGFVAFLLAREAASLVLEGEFEATGPGEFGVLFRGAGDGDDATYVSLAPSLRRVQLYTLQSYYKTPCADVTYRWRGRRLVQEWVCPFEWRLPLCLRVVAYGPYCEVSVNDRTVISAITMCRPAGRIGFFAEDTVLDVRKISLQLLRFTRTANAPSRQGT